MIDVTFSAQDNGACPYCLYYEECPIQHSIIETLNSGIQTDDTDYDDFEIVIYRCPKFVENM